MTRTQAKSMIFFPIAAIVGFGIFLFVDHFTEKWAGTSSEPQVMMEIMKDPALAGKLMRAGSDPGVLKTLTPAQKQKVGSLKSTIMNSKDQGVMGMVTRMVGDSSLADKLMRAKGNRAALKNLSAAEKQKLKQIKDSLSPSEIQSLKNQYGHG